VIADEVELVVVTKEKVTAGARKKKDSHIDPESDLSGDLEQHPF
jgi:hypothetical protein